LRIFLTLCRKSKIPKRRSSGESSSSVESTPQLTPESNLKNPIVKLLPVQENVIFPTWETLEEKLKNGKSIDSNELLRTVIYRVESSWPMLKLVIETAPREIMKACKAKPSGKERDVNFPEVMDFMFQWGVDLERKKIRNAMANNQDDIKDIPVLPKKESRSETLPQQVIIKFLCFM